MSSGIMMMENSVPEVEMVNGSDNEMNNNTVSMGIGGYIGDDGEKLSSASRNSFVNGSH